MGCDGSSQSHATPHWGPCYAAIFPVTILPAADVFCCTAKTEAWPPRFEKPCFAGLPTGASPPVNVDHVLDCQPAPFDGTAKCVPKKGWFYGTDNYIAIVQQWRLISRISTGSVMACFNFLLLRSKSPGRPSADTGSACMMWSQHPTRNKTTFRCSGLSPVRYALLPHNPDIPIAVRRECPLAYRGNRPGIHSRHGHLVPPTAGEKGDTQAFRNTSHIYDSQALTLHPLSACSQGSGRQQARKRRGPGRPQTGRYFGFPNV